MLTAVHPKLPMRNKAVTKVFYIDKLGFKNLGTSDYDGYLMLEKDNIQIHFFEFKDIVPAENYGQVYIRTDDIDTLYKTFSENKAGIHPNGHLKVQPWGQKEFSILDPDNNLLTFGQDL
jgi:catechol 2,3-dioxygenase-like lactoylglutathione lyase family enzyme